MEKTVTAYLKHLKIPVSTTYVEKLIQSHPDYPSLLSITDVLERLGIQQKVFRIEKEELSNVPFPYMLHTGVCGGDLIYISDHNALETNQSDLEKWDGLLFQVTPTDHLIDKDHQVQQSDERFLKNVTHTLLASLLGLMIFSILQFVSWTFAALLLTAVAGAATGYLLFAKEMGVKYKAVEAFCNAGNMSSCNKVLFSKDAKLFGRITFSDITLSYFVFQLLVVGGLMPLLVDGGPWLIILAGLGIGALPIVMYSLYYQYIKAKTWCRLCLIVDGVLVLQATLFIFLFLQGMITLEFASLLPVLFSAGTLVTIGSAIVLLKSRFETFSRLAEDEINLLRIKHTVPVFSHFLFQERKIDAELFEKELLIGERDAPVNILMAAGLFCNPCKSKFETLQSLLTAYPGKVNLSIRFLPSQDQNNPAHYLLSYWLTHIQGRPDESILSRNLLNDWYEFMDIEQFMKKYELGTGVDFTATGKLEVQFMEWFKEANIKETPKFFINGYELPKEYGLEDLMAVIPSLVDTFQSRKKEFIQQGAQVIL